MGVALRRALVEGSRDRGGRHACRTGQGNATGRRRAQQHQPAVRRDRTAREIGGNLLALNGWKIEREKGIFGHGGRGAFVAAAEVRLVTNFLPDSQRLRPRSPLLHRPMLNRAG